MRFQIVMEATSFGVLIPFNYSYPLSAAIYKIVQRGDSEYASFLHEKGYGKGFKFFTFSQLVFPFALRTEGFE